MKHFACVMVYFLIAAPASAALQPFPNTSEPSPPELMIPQTQEHLDSKQVREGMVKFARCIARRRPQEAKDFVLQQSLATWKALEKNLDSSCALEAVDEPGEEVEVRSNGRDILFALGEVLAQRELDRFLPSEVANTSKLPATDGVMIAGECAVRAAPTYARALLKSKLNSQAELAAAHAMAPALASCLPSGQQVRFDVAYLRGLVAVIYYRLALAPKDLPTEPQQ